MPTQDLTTVGAAATRRRARRRTRARAQLNGPIGGVRTGAGTGIGSNVATGGLDYTNLNAREQKIASHFLEVGCRMYGNPVPSWLGKTR